MRKIKFRFLSWQIYAMSFTFIMISCNIGPSIEDSKSAVIEGQVFDEGIKEIVIDGFKDNPYSREQKKFSTIIDSASRFFFKIPITGFSSGMIAIGDYSGAISLTPGDEIFIEFKSGEIEFAGRGSTKNRFLDELKNQNINDSQIVEAFNSGELPPSDFLSLIQEFSSKKKEILHTFRDKIDPDYVTYFNIVVRTTASWLLQQYHYKYTNNKENSLDSLTFPEEYESVRQLSTIVNDSFVVSPSYSATLNTPINFAAQELVNKDKCPTIKEATYRVIFNSLNEKTKEYYLANSIEYLYMVNRVDTLLTNEFDNVATNSMAIQAVNIAKNKFNAKHSLKGKKLIDEFRNTILIDTDDNETTLGDVLDNHSGRVVYLDLWSLTCPPCLRAMPFAKELKVKLRDVPIDYLYITLDPYTPQLWKKVFETTSSDSGHYLLKNRFESQMLKYMGVNYVPIYMIFDKDGQIADVNAISPLSLQEGSNELETKLRSVANE